MKQRFVAIILRFELIVVLLRGIFLRELNSVLFLRQRILSGKRPGNTAKEGLKSPKNKAPKSYLYLGGPIYEFRARYETYEGL